MNFSPAISGRTHDFPELPTLKKCVCLFFTGITLSDQALKRGTNFMRACRNKRRKKKGVSDGLKKY